MIASNRFIKLCHETTSSKYAEMEVGPTLNNGTRTIFKNIKIKAIFYRYCVTYNSFCDRAGNSLITEDYLGLYTVRHMIILTLNIATDLFVHAISPTTCPFAESYYSWPMADLSYSFVDASYMSHIEVNTIHRNTVHCSFRGNLIRGERETGGP